MEKNTLIKKVEDINKEVNKIFDIVSDEKEISVYKSELLNAKLNLLSDSLDDTMLTLIGSTIYEAKVIMLRKAFQILLSIVSLIVMFINLPFGIGLSLFTILGWNKLNKEAISKSKEIIRVDEITKMANEMVNTFDNCYSFLNSRTNYKLENKKEDLEDAELRKIDIANHHIELIMANGVKETIPEEIKNIMIQMLQEDLQVQEKDLDKLIELAIQKILLEEKQNEQGMGLKRAKDKESSGKNAKQ